MSFLFFSLSTIFYRKFDISLEGMTSRGYWLHLESAGRRVCMSDGAILEGWSVGGQQELPGYHGQRIVKLLDSTECSVSMRVFAVDDSKRQEAVYSCSCSCDGELHRSADVRGSSSTAVCNNFLVSCGAKLQGGGKRWPGPSFFGFDRQDVSVLCNEAIALPPVENAAAYLTSPLEAKDLPFSRAGSGKSHDLVSWGGILEYGQAIEDVHWLLPFGENHVIYLRDGYVSKRVIAMPMGDVDVLCKIFSGEDKDQASSAHGSLLRARTKRSFLAV